MKELKFVYMLRADCDEFNIDGWIVKIGISKNIGNRLSNIQSGCPFKLRVHCTGKTYSAEKYESKLHDRLSKFKMNGEWFLLDDETFDWVVNFLYLITKEFRGEHALV